MAGLKLSAQLKNFEAIMNFILEEAALDGFDKATSNKIRLACEEIVINVINYAYKDKHGEIEIITDTNRADNQFFIEIRDNGIPFNPLEQPEPEIDVPVHERKIGGLGIFLVRKVMDSVQYQRRNNMNIVILTKYKHPSPKEGSL